MITARQMGSSTTLGPVFCGIMLKTDAWISHREDSFLRRDPDEEVIG